MTTEDDGLLKPDEAAHYLGITRSRLKKHTAERELPFIEFGPHTKRYERAALDKFKADRMVPAKPASRRALGGAKRRKAA